MSLEVAPIGWELLDDPRAAPARVTESLYNIARANRWFGGAAAVRFGLEQALSAGQATGSLTLLDVGTGLGDLPRMAVAWAARRGITLRAVGLERHGVAARLAGRQGVAAVIGDGGALPFATGSFDLVLLSQVVHHFAAEAIVRLLRECGRVAGRAVIVADLRRTGHVHPAWRWGILTMICSFLAIEAVTYSSFGDAVYRTITADSPGAKVPPLQFAPPPAGPLVTGRD